MQKHGVDKQEIFVPFVIYAIRQLLAASVSDEMHVRQINLISAYVQARTHDEIYMELSEMLLQNK